MNWYSNKYKRPVRRFGAAEMLAAVDGMDEGKDPSVHCVAPSGEESPATSCTGLLVHFHKVVY